MSNVNFYSVCLTLISITAYLIISSSYYLLWLCDSCLFIPFNVYIVYYLGTMDVIHSFGLSSLGMRVDCIPGRINCLFELVKFCGKLKGLCYELCGQYHSSMIILGFCLFV